MSSDYGLKMEPGSNQYTWLFSLTIVRGILTDYEINI